jgi:ubiquitin-protein ligase
VFDFTFAINLNYPHEPPKVRCTQKVGAGAAADGVTDLPPQP